MVFKLYFTSDGMDNLTELILFLLSLFQISSPPIIEETQTRDLYKVTGPEQLQNV